MIPVTVRHTLPWVAVAAVGVALTTAMTITTTLLTQQSIALSSEPLSAGNALVPLKPLVPASAKKVVRVNAKPKPLAVVQAPAASAPTLTHALSTTRMPVAPATVASTPKRAIHRGASGEQGNQDGAQNQDGAVQSGQNEADD